jgi:hypothetical protein
MIGPLSEEKNFGSGLFNLDHSHEDWKFLLLSFLNRKEGSKMNKPSKAILEIEEKIRSVQYKMCKLENVLNSKFSLIDEMMKAWMDEKRSKRRSRDRSPATEEELYEDTRCDLIWQQT